MGGRIWFGLSGRSLDSELAWRSSRRDGATDDPDLRVELILGSSVDPQFGPVLLFGSGGQLVELQCRGPIGGWKFGNTIDGARAEYLLVPNAQANLAKIPDDLSDEQVVLLADIGSTGISAAESGGVKLGDTVAVFAQRPIGLCATAGAKLRGAGLIIAVESDPVRAAMAKRMGADVVVDHTRTDAVEEIRRITAGKGVHVAIEALGTQATFESALRVLRSGGTLSSLGVYSGKLSVPLEPFAAGLGDHKIVTTLCPGGKERMRRLMELVRHGGWTSGHS
jgi:threonine dehydrogenase-like Zn-dependent dehydrogenase